MAALRTVTTSGRGTVDVPRDAAQIDIGLEFAAVGVAPALAGAQSAQQEAMTVLLRFVERDQVASQGLRVHPDHRRDGEGFVASHSMRVTGLPIDRATDLVAALAEEVGDRLRLHGLELVATDLDEARRLAREAAVADAHERAEHLAALTSSRLGDVVAVVDRADAGGESSDWMGRTGRMGETMRGGGSVEGGQAEVQQSVTVTWELTPDR